MAQTRFRRASSCRFIMSGGAFACRSVSKLCLSRPPIRRSSAMALRSRCAASLPPKKRRRIYSDKDSPAISACSMRRVFSLSVTRIVTHFRAALRPPSSVFLSFMPWPLECEKRSAEQSGSPEGVSLLAGWGCGVAPPPSCHEEPTSCSGEIVGR